MLAAWLVAAVAAFPPSGTYNYDAALNGSPVGRWSVAVKSGQNGSEVDETSTATLAGLALSAQAALVLDVNLAPASYAGHYRTPGQSPNVSVSLTPQSATVAGAFNAQPQQVALQNETRHFVVIEPGLLAGLFVLPAQLAAWKEQSVTWITPTTAQVHVLEVAVASPPPRPNAVPAGDNVLSIAQPIAVTIWYDPSTLVPDEIEVPSQAAVLTRVR
ncbi:MAG TPA: hypothetical protein VGX91_05115 [Candidatus Cybelea sp.]|nr:hypothetical protein [Candidatus Cybelea sp.]